jgi:hypothetical protein
MEEKQFSGLYLVDLRLFHVLLHELMQVKLLVLAGETDLTARVNRGVAPADAPLASPRSWRPRRVEDAATSTRFIPLKFQSGDLAAACWCLFSPSGEAEALLQAAADFDLHRRSRWHGCTFYFFRVLSVKWGQLPKFWIVPVTSCFLA